MAMRQRVVAYITRERNGVTELLVFMHRDFPDAGMQVPAGGIEPGEALDEAVLREVREESGVAGATLVKKLAEEENETGEANNHIFHLPAPADIADAWDWVADEYHSAEHRARGERLVFCFSWIAVELGQKMLAGGQGKWLPLLRE